jgi:hypothetical protein
MVKLSRAAVFKGRYKSSDKRAVFRLFNAPPSWKIPALSKDGFPVRSMTTNRRKMKSRHGNPNSTELTEFFG